MSDPKPVEFLGSSLDDLRAFPLIARREAGHQIDQVQRGREPDDWKPMSTVCHRPAHWSQLMIGTMEPPHDRHIEASAGSA